MIRFLSVYGSEHLGLPSMGNDCARVVLLATFKGKAGFYVSKEDRSLFRDTASNVCEPSISLLV